MKPISKFALGAGVASGALLTAWLLTGNRKSRTKKYLVQKTDDLRKSLQNEKPVFDDSEAHYI